MLTSEEFTELVFGGASPLANSPLLRQEEVSCEVQYRHLFRQNGRDITYMVTIVVTTVNGFSPPLTDHCHLFTVITDEEGYEQELVRATQEFVGRLSSLEEFHHLALLLTASQVELAPTLLRELWCGDDLRVGYSPLERLLLASYTGAMTLDRRGIKNFLSPQEALSHIPERFTFVDETLSQGTLFELVVDAQGKQQASFLPASLGKTYLAGTPVTKRAFEEVLAFCKNFDESDGYPRDLLGLLQLTPWHPEQRPEGVAYADLFPVGSDLSSQFLNCLFEDVYEEDLYLGLRWLQEHWPLLPSPWASTVVSLIEEWTSPTTPGGREQMKAILREAWESKPFIGFFLQALLPHRSEFTEAERLQLLVYFIGYDLNGVPLALAVAPTYHRLLSYLLKELGPLPLARLFLTWPLGEEGIYHTREAELLVSHPEWHSLPPTWWLPLLRAEAAGGEEKLYAIEELE